MAECRIYNSEGTQIAAFDTNNFGPVITIGRSSHCDVCLKAAVDTSVSREHLVLERQAFTWRLTNKSRFGMYKDGVKYDSVELNDGDIYRFTKLFFCYGATAKPSSYDLTWTAETETGQHRAVLWPGTNTIGASNDNYVTIRTNDISRIHAHINIFQGRVTFKNINPDNPSLINGQEVGQEITELHVNDVLTLAETEVKLVDGIRFQANTVKTASQVKTMQKSATSKGGYYLMVFFNLIVIGLLIYMGYYLFNNLL